MTFDSPTLWWSLFAVSLVVMLASVLVIPWLIVRIPTDYFLDRRPPPNPFAQHHPVIRLVLMVLKNGLGLLLVLGGIAMLVLPGQGLLTIAAGLLLMNFPGKRRLECWLVAQPAVGRSLNWIRAKAGCEPLRIRPPHGDGAVTEGRVSNERSGIHPGELSAKEPMKDGCNECEGR